MARALRLEYEGAIYHVIARGDRREAIYRDDRDRQRFLEKLAETVGIYHLLVYAYVMMSNHYHLLLCTPRSNLSQAMQQFQTSYSTYFRTRHQISGHVFGGRYKAPLVEGDRYLLALTRYLHLNPVRTRQWVNTALSERRKALRAYRWSSYPGYVGIAKADEWIAQGPMIKLVGGGRWGYRRYVERGLSEKDEELSEAFARSSKAIGDEAFCTWAEEQYAEMTNRQGAPEDVAMRRREVAASPDVLLAQVASIFGLTPDELVNQRGSSLERDVLIWAWRRYSGLSNRAIGHRLGHADGSTVGKRVAVMLSKHQRITEVEKIARGL
jgi:REP element-mobilizing transposase RayT